MIALFGVGLVALALPVGAQQPERAVFVVRHGSDTVAAEIATVGNGRAEGDLRYRTPVLRMRRVFALSPTFELERLDLTSGSGPRGDSAMSRRVMTVRGDSADLRVEMPVGATPPQPRSFGLPRGILPLVNLSGLMLELVLRRARAVGGDSVVVPLFAGVGKTVSASVTRVGPRDGAHRRAGENRRAILSFQRRYAIEHEPSIPVALRDSVVAAGDKAAEAVYAAPGWLNFFADYDPLVAARRVRTPTLVLQGETDTQVTPDQASTLAAAMRAGGNRRVTVRTFPRMNHLMLDDPSGDSGGYGKLPSYAARRDFLGVVADWLASTL